MGLLSLCDGDPVVEYLRSTFGANIVRIPRASLRPLEVLAAHLGDTTKTMGQLGDILVGAPRFALARVSNDHAPCHGVLTAGKGFSGSLAPMT